MIKWIISGTTLLVLIIVGLSFYLQPNSFIGCQEKPIMSTSCGSADAIVVISGGDTNRRTDEGIKLYKNGWADLIIFAGAAQDKSGPSNAAVMKQRALDSGIPNSAIFIDEFSETTEQNAANTADLLSDNNIKTVILVTSGYHQRRASLEFARYTGEGIEIKNYPVTVDKDWSPFWWMTPRGWWLAGSELVKIIAFHIQGAVR